MFGLEEDTGFAMNGRGIQVCSVERQDIHRTGKSIDVDGAAACLPGDLYSIDCYLSPWLMSYHLMGVSVPAEGSCPSRGQHTLEGS